MSRKFPASFRVFRRGCWNCILRVQGNILAENSWISICFFIFGQWAIFSTNSRKKVAELSKLDSQFQWRLLGASLLQNLQIDIFLNFDRKYFGWLSKKVSGAFKLLSTSPWEQFQEKFSKSFCIFSGLFWIISSNWARKTFVGLSKLHSLYL